MGFLTTVIVRNDALHVFEDNPKGFGEAILEGINRANLEQAQVSVPFEGYANYIEVEPSRHADHHVVFLSMGNCVTAIGKWEKDWARLVKTNPEFAKRLVMEAETLIKEAKESLKELKP